MADLRYDVSIETKQAQAALKNLRSSIGGIATALGAAFAVQQLTSISARFQDLRTTLGILFKDVDKGAQAFNQIKAFAQQSIFSVEDLTNTIVKLKAAGLNPTIEQLRLFADVSSVAVDSVGALQAITDLFARTTEGGLGLEDLNRLADRGIPVFKILGDKLGLSRLEISKFGQTSEGAKVILAALTAGLQEAFGNASAARANNLSQAISNLKDALANAADSVGENGFAGELTKAIQNLTKFIEENQKFIDAIGAGLGGAITFVVDNLKLLTAAFAAAFAVQVAITILKIVQALAKMRETMKGVAIAAAVLQGVTGVGLIKLAAGMAAVAGIIAGIEAYTGDAKDQVKDLQKEIDNLDKQPGTIPAGPIPEKAPEDSSNYKQQLEEIKKKQDDITRASIDYFNQYRDSVADVRAKVNEEAKLVKLTEAEQNIQRDLSAFSQKYYDTIRPLQQQLLELKKSEKEEDKIKADEIQKQLGLITQLYNTSIGGLKAELELREQNRIAEETRVALMNNRRDLEEELTDLITKSKQELEDLDLNPFQLQIKELNRAVDDKLVASIRNIKSQWENGLISGDQYIKEIERLKEMANKSFEEIKKNAERTREIQRSFQYGWRQAFEAYVDDATNAAKAAQKIFEQTTKGIEDRIVDFVKTGKFEFRSLINDILETILRSQIQQLIAKTFGLFGKAGGSNIFGTMFAGFFANGGMIPSGSFGVVGERGPELVSGPAQVTPLAPSGSVTYNINAVDAASFKQMVARDPGFIHAVAQQGARKVPVRR